LIGLPDSEHFHAGVDLLERAVAQGEPKAMATLGVLKFVGFFGLPRDTAGGRLLLERAAPFGDGPAARGGAFGYGTGWAGAVDLERMVKFMAMAVVRNDSEAMFLFARMLGEGVGVAKNQRESERLMLSAAEAGYTEAEVGLGIANLRAYAAGATA